MIYWNRFISYIYRFHRNEKCENAGFIKFQKAGSRARINIGMKNIMSGGEMTYSVYLYLETLEYGTENEAVSRERQITIPAMMEIGKMRMKNGRGEAAFEVDWNNVGDSGKPVTAMRGVIIHGKGQTDMFCSSWSDNIVNYDKAYIWQQPEPELSLEPKREPEPEREAELQHMNEPMTEPDLKSEIEHKPEPEAYQAVSDADVLSRIMDTHEKLPVLFAGEDGGEMIECVKITPNDIGLTDMANWHLGANSFLTHGFYNYKYLLFGRFATSVYDERPAYLIGIPGVYTSKEKYLAHMFGFDRFCPEQNNHTYKTGRFGYWITGISS